MSINTEFGLYEDAGPEDLLRNIQAYLATPDAIASMEAGSLAGIPAVVPLSKSLLQKFGVVVKQNRLKQFIGWSARNILEKRGYIVEQRGCKVHSKGNIFSVASRYKKA